MTTPHACAFCFLFPPLLLLQSLPVRSSWDGLSGRGALFLAATTLPALLTPSVGLMTLSPSPVGRQAQVVEHNREVYVGTRGARPSAGQRQTSRSEEETNDMLLFGQSVVMAEEPAPSNHFRLIPRPTN